MHDFPPVVPDFENTPVTTTGRPRRTRRDFSHPDTRGPSHFLRWLLGQQMSVLVVSSAVGLVQFLPGAIGPYLVGRAVDDGITTGDLRSVVNWSLLLLVAIVLGAGAGVLRHTYIVRTWLVAMYGLTKLVTRKTTQMGHVQSRRMPTGEILSVSTSDGDQFGGLGEIISRAVGAGIAYLLVAGIVLKTSPFLGVLVLAAAPILVLLALPLLKPLERRQAVERSTSAELTSMATDIVAGLRILRGIGGERTFARNYATQSQTVRRAGVAAGTWQAVVDATGVLFAGLFLVCLTWLGSRQVAAGTLSVGQLISFFGYAVFMVWPIQSFFELAQKWVRAKVSARRTIAVLGQQPPWDSPVNPVALPLGAPIADQVSGFVGEPGMLSVVVSGVPDDSAALADRLGRYLAAESDPISLNIDETKGRQIKAARARQDAARAEIAARDRAVAERRWGVTIGGVDLADVDIDDVRRHVLVNDTAGLVFAGTLQTAIDPHESLSREQAEAALHTAAAEDVFEAMPGGWQGIIDERGRGLSGGQRQRLTLARALAADPEILVLVEPTSAVDAHTEAIIASRLRAARVGRTTVVMSVSPLLLHHADRVVFLTDGAVGDVGTHEELLTRNAGYRRVVVRSLEDDDA